MKYVAALSLIALVVIAAVSVFFFLRAREHDAAEARAMEAHKARTERLIQEDVQAAEKARESMRR